MAVLFASQSFCSKDCESDGECNDAFGNIHDKLASLLVRLDKSPAKVLLPHPRTGEQSEIEVTREAVLGILFGALYSDV
jgi:hypothetical protein